MRQKLSERAIRDEDLDVFSGQHGAVTNCLNLDADVDLAACGVTCSRIVDRELETI